MQDINNVFEANVRFRTQGNGEYDFVMMDVEADRLIAEIPADAVSSEGLEYYIEVAMDDQSRITYPPNGPESNPIMITVRAGDEEAAIESGVVIISPEPNVVNEEMELMIAVTFNPTVYEVDPKDVILRLDGKDISGKATITSDILIAMIDDAEPGGHRIDLLVKDGNREKLLRNWVFDYISPLDMMESGGLGEDYKLTGSVGLDGRAQQYSGIRQNVMRETVNLRLKKDDFRAQAYVRTTSEESGLMQPQHRFRVTAGWPMFQIGLGDLSPKYSQMILYGNRVRGAEMKFRAGNFAIKSIYGELRRGIDGMGYTVTGSNTDPFGIDYNTYNYDPGTYKRWLAAVRMGIGNPNGTQWGFTVMKVRDDTTSVANERPSELEQRLLDSLDVDVNYISTPKDNLVIGSDLRMQFDRKRVQVTAEAALSLYNANISERALGDLENVQDIIWVNQYFEPLPSEGLSGNSSDSDIKIGEVASSVIKNALSWQGKVRLRYFGHDVRTGYKFLNRSYVSLGNPSLANDDAGFYLYDRFRVWDNRLYLNAGYRNFHNNVQGNSETTLNRSEIIFGFNVYTGTTMPDVNFSFRQQLNENDGSLTEVITDTTAYNLGDPDGSEIFDDRSSSNTGSYGVGLSHRLMYMNTMNNLSLNYMVANRKDEYQDFGDSQTNLIGFNASTDYSHYAPLSSRLSFSQTSQASMNDLTELTYTILMVRVSYYMFNRTFVPYINPKITKGSGDYSLVFDDTVPTDLAGTPRLQKIDFNRFDLVGGFEWRFMQNHTVMGRASVSSYSENGEIEYFDGHTDPIDSDLIDRGDYSFMFSYMYKF